MKNLLRDIQHSTRSLRKNPSFMAVAVLTIALGRLGGRRAHAYPRPHGRRAFGLLIACANVPNLLLVRSAARERELAVRAAQ